MCGYHGCFEAWGCSMTANKIYSSQLISYCIKSGLESAQAVMIIFAVSPRVGVEDQITYNLGDLHLNVNDVLMRATSMDDAVLRGYQAMMAYMRDRGLLEIVVVR